jgi:hypothetical protein
MEPHAHDGHRPATALAILAAAAGMVLTGCGPSSGSSAASTQSAASTRSAADAQSSGTSSATSSSGSSAAVVSSASLPFPTTAGDTWIYKNTNGTTSENKIASVTQVASGQQVTMDTAFTDGGTTTRSHYAYIVQPNGQISLPFSQFGSSGSSGGFSVKLISGSLFWPSAAELASGRPYHSTLTLAYTIAGKKQQVTMHATATGEGTESVTVPAGTYSATVVSEVESEKFDGVNISTDVKTWLASGVGPVQSELVNIDGTTQNITNKEELTSFVKG